MQWKEEERKEITGMKGRRENTGEADVMEIPVGIWSVTGKGSRINEGSVGDISIFHNSKIEI